MIPSRQPQTYQEWLDALNNSTQQSDMLKCAIAAAKMAPNTKAAFHDASLVIAGMYKREMIKAPDSPMVERNVKNRFTCVTRKLFQAPMDKVLEYVLATEPSFDTQGRFRQSGGLGYIAPPHKDGKSSLGFL